MNENNKKPKNTYESAGVSIDKGEQLVEQIKSIAAGTHIKGVMNGLGGFGALFDLKQHEYRHPVLVAGTDGVGTKIRLAIQSGRHDCIGIDLVAMCVNDLLVQGAEPLFFLDYLACSRLDVEIATTVINGIAEGCKQAGCALIGGETAEMPGMYADGDYDLAGFCVGVVEKENIIDGAKVKAGDILIGLGSSGPHSNGYSLIRKIFTDENISYDQMLDDRKFIDVLIEPTSIYVKPVMQLLKSVRVNAMAHITGGGLYENIPRVMPKDVQVVIDSKSWQWPEIFSWLQESGNIDTEEMYRTFNCGVGMVICVDESDKNTAIKKLEENGVTAFEIGKVSAHTGDPVVVIK